MVADDNTIQKNINRGSLCPLVYLGIAVLLLWVLAWGIIVIALPEWSDRGQFGDMFGSINSLFSGLAFAGVIFTIYLQREELILQRKELQLTRDQLKRTADAQEKSEKALGQQVEALLLAARLNGLNSMIEHYNLKIKRSNSTAKTEIALKEQTKLIEKLEQEINDFYQK